MEYQGETPERKFRDDTSDFDNAMDEHAPAMRDSLQNTDAFVRGIVSSMISPPQRKSKAKASRRASAMASTSSHGTVRQRDTGHPHRAASLSVTSPSQATPTSSLPSVDEISLLINRLASERQKTANLQASLTQAHGDLAFQTKRFEEADTKLKELRMKEEEANAKRKNLEIEVSKIREQLRFLKTQYDSAIDEIKKAQKDIDTLDDERHRAVEEVHREKEKVRKLVEEKKVREAREAGYMEGKRLGVEEGVRMGRQEGRRYGVQDGQEAEKERQKQAMLDLVNRDDLYDLDTRPTRIREEPVVTETYNVVGDETPGERRPDLNRQNSGNTAPTRSNSFNVRPAQTPAPAPVVTVDPQRHTANVFNLPIANNVPSTAPAGSSAFAPNINPYGSSNPNINIYAGAGPDDLPPNPPSMSTRSSNRVSAPPRVNTGSAGPEVGYGRAAHPNFVVPAAHPNFAVPTGQDLNGGVMANGSTARAPTRFSNKSSGRSGRASVTPPSISTDGGRSTPMEQYGLLNGQGGRRGSDAQGLLDPVNEMTPIMERMSEAASPSPSPGKAYFGDAAMGVRIQPPENHGKRGRRNSTAQHPSHVNPDPVFNPAPNSYVPPHRRTPQPSPTNTNPPSDGQWPRRSPNPAGPQRSPAPPGPATANFQSRQQRKPVPSVNGFGPKETKKTHARAVSESVAMPPPIAIDPGTPPEARNKRNSKMLQAGDSLLGSASFAPHRPPESSPLRNGLTLDARGGPNGANGSYGPNGTPLMHPQPMRSPSMPPSPLSREAEFRTSDPSGGVYHPSNQPGSAHQRSMSMQNPLRSPARSPIPSPARVNQHIPPGSPARFSNPDIAQPTPRHYSRTLEQSPEEIQIRSPNYNTPTPIMIPPSVSVSPFGQKKSSTAQDKKRRREGYVDYDDNVPEITTLGFGVHEAEPPNTTRSRVQSMYGIKTPNYEAAPLPQSKGKTPAYESAPLPPPKSARMMKSNLPQQPAGSPYGFGANGAPVPSPAVRSMSSSQYRAEMEEELDAPIVPYGHANEDDHRSSHFADIDKLEEVADRYDTRSGKFLPMSLPTVVEHGVEIVPPPNASPSTRPVQQDISFLNTGGHPMAPPSPNMPMRGRPSDYVGTSHIDESGVILPPNPSNVYGQPSPSPMRQSLPVTASARSSTNPLPPVRPSDLPWATGKSTNSQLPRVTTYEPAPGMPNTATTWGGFRDSSQTLEPVGPIGGDGLGFTWTQSGQYDLNRSPVATDRLMNQSLPPTGSARAMSSMLPPGSTRSIAMPISPMAPVGSIVMQPALMGSQQALRNLLSDPQEDAEEEPIVPSMPSAGAPMKKGKKKGKKK